MDDQEIIIVGVFPQTPEIVVEKLQRALKQLQPSREIIACDFGNETFLKSADEYSTLLTSYVNSSETLQIVPQIIFGGLKADGVLPFTASARALSRLITCDPPPTSTSWNSTDGGVQGDMG